MMNLFVMLGAIGAPEVILIVLALVLLFGGKKIPELMRGLGEGVKEFKKSSNGTPDEKSTSTEKKADATSN